MRALFAEGRWISGGDPHITLRAAVDAIAATSSSLTASPAPRKPAPMMRVRSRAFSRPDEKRSKNKTTNEVQET